MFDVVVVHWGGIGVTLDCVNSIVDNTPFDTYHLTLVVNDGRKDHADLLRAYSRTARVGDTSCEKRIKSVILLDDTPLANAWNKGVDATSSSWIAILNNDVVVQRGWLDELSKNIRRDIGIIGITGHLLSDDYNHRGVVLKGQDYDYVGGQCFLVNREAWDDIGGFDAGFRLFSEDADFSLRLRKGGWKLWVEHSARNFIHHIGNVHSSKRIEAEQWKRDGLLRMRAKHGEKYVR